MMTRICSPRSTSPRRREPNSLGERTISINPTGPHASAGATTRTAGGKKARNRQSAEIKLAEIKHRLLEISDLGAAGAVLGWDQSTYMPKGGASARARQGAMLSRLAHEKSGDPEVGELLDDLAPYAAGLPNDSDEASLIRVARRDFEKAIKVPADYFARAS